MQKTIIASLQQEENQDLSRLRRTAIEPIFDLIAKAD